jgi:hypothetical protein
VDVRLPETVKVEIDGLDRTDTLFAVFPQLTTNYGFDPIALGSGVVVIDESLPWQLHTDEATLDGARLDLGASVSTSFRVAGGGTTSRPDNNLAFLRPSYKSISAEVTHDGLTGDFATADAIEYATSFPAGFVVTSQGGTLRIVDSQIAGGFSGKPRRRSPTMRTEWSSTTLPATGSATPGPGHGTACVRDS